MKTIRIIPRLDIKGPNLVKGIHLEGLRALGTPEDFARHYYELGADELFYQDVVASLYERNSLTDIITRTAKMAFIPITVGGGLRTIEDISKVLRAGADKVAINTAAIKDPDFIKGAVRVFGSSTITIAIEAIKQNDNKYLAYIDNGREFTGIEVVEWAQRVEKLGAGEICVTSIDREGTGLGFDTELTKRIAEAVNVPVIAHGGAGKRGDILNVITTANVDAVAISSILHYGFLSEETDELESREEGNFEFLKRKTNFKKIKPTDINSIKLYLRKNGVNCRYWMKENTE